MIKLTIMKELKIRSDLIIKILIGTLALPVVVYNIDGLVNSGKIHYGVTIHGQKVGGLDTGEAAKKLAPLKQELEKKPVKLQWDERTWALYPKEVEATVQLSSAIEKAVKIGFEGSLADRITQRTSALLGRQEVSLEVRVDTRKANDVISRIASGIDKPAMNPTVIIQGNKAVSAEGQTGLLLSKGKIKDVMASAILDAKGRNHKLPVLVIPTSIKYESAVKEAVKANVMLSAPVKIKYSESNWELDQKSLAELIEVAEVKNPGQVGLIARMNSERAKAKLNYLARGVIREPQDAKFSVNGKKVIVIPSKDGVSVNFEKAIEDLNIVAANKQIVERELLLTSSTTPAKLTTEKAQGMGIKEKVAAYSTTYSALAAARVNNIHQLTKALDGTIVGPGETFSFNKTIGPRTAAKGYKEAPVIVNGKLMPGLGGGVCQVATTMFNATFFAGLPVLERRNHSFYISKYPTGRDASVSYPYPDLKFKNDTSAYILIKGSFSSNSVTISLYGTDPDRKVSYTTTGFSGITAFPVERKPDPNLDEGIENIVDGGEPGKQVSVYRTVSKDGKVLFKDTFVSKYKPKTQVVNFGTRLPVVLPTSSVETAL